MPVLWTSVTPAGGIENKTGIVHVLHNFSGSSYSPRTALGCWELSERNFCRGTLRAARRTGGLQPQRSGMRCSFMLLCDAIVVGTCPRVAHDVRPHTGKLCEQRTASAVPFTVATWPEGTLGPVECTPLVADCEGPHTTSRPLSLLR